MLNLLQLQYIQGAKDHKTGSTGRATKVHSHAEPKRVAVPKRLSQANKHWTPSLTG